MKNIARKKVKPKSNVINISVNPKHKTTKKPLNTTSLLEKEGDFERIILKSDCLGFREGNEFLCGKDFNPKEITPNTLVVAKFTVGSKRVLSAGQVSARNILSVLVAFTKEVADGK